MLRWSVIGVVAAAVLSFAPVVANANPVAPMADQSCAANLDGAMTWPAGDEAPLVCADGRWRPVADPYPISDRWLSYGPVMTLHGEGRRNPTLESGNWTAAPQDPDTRCTATQLAVIPGSPTVGPPRIEQGDPGQPLSLQIVPRLFTVEMSGDCLWQRSDPGAK